MGPPLTYSAPFLSTSIFTVIFALLSANSTRMWLRTSSKLFIVVVLLLIVRYRISSGSSVALIFIDGRQQPKQPRPSHLGHRYELIAGQSHKHSAIGSWLDADFEFHAFHLRSPSSCCMSAAALLHERSERVVMRLCPWARLRRARRRRDHRER